MVSLGDDTVAFGSELGPKPLQQAAGLETSLFLPFCELSRSELPWLLEDLVVRDNIGLRVTVTCNLTLFTRQTVGPQGLAVFAD